MSRQLEYINETRAHTRAIWEATLALKALQTEHNALDYGNTLEDGTGENEGITADEVGAVVFATTDAIITVFNAGNATNLAKLL